MHTPVNPMGGCSILNPMTTSDINGPGSDLQARWLPNAEQTSAAVAVLMTVPEDQRDRFYAVVALAQPGKEYGLWETGQQVVALPGVWLGENTRDDERTPYPLRAATQQAEEVARHWLTSQGLTGTVAYAFIDADGEAAVFEGFGPTT